MPLSDHKFRQRYLDFFIYYPFGKEVLKKRRDNISKYNVEILSNYENRKVFLGDLYKNIPRNNKGQISKALLNDMYFNISGVKKLDLTHLGKIPFNIRIEDCTIIKELEFLNDDQYLNLEFNKCNFNSDFSAPLHKTFNNEISIFDCHFIKGIYLCYSTFNDDLVISSCTFHNEFEIYSCTFLKTLELRSLTFKKNLPNFNFTKFSTTPNVSSFSFKDKEILRNNEGLTDEENIDKATVYRKLKFLAQANKDHLFELRYFALENSTLLSTKAHNSAWLASIYRALSNYGQGVIRPFIWMYLFFVLFLTINYNCIETRKVDCGDEVLFTVEIITLNNIIPFGLGFDKGTSMCVNKSFGSSNSMPVSIQIINMFHKIINLLLWFLVFLAIRNKFKI